MKFTDMSPDEQLAYIASIDTDTTVQEKFHTWGQSAPVLKSNILGIGAGVGAVYAGLTVAPVLTAIACISYAGMTISDKVQKLSMSHFSTDKPRQKEVDALKSVHASSSK